MTGPSKTAKPSSPTKATGPKILRACVVQGGKVIEEKRLRRRGPLTVGTGPKNTFVIADPALPRAHELFAAKGGQYELVFTEAMRGKISTSGNPRPVDFASLKAQGLVKKKGGAYHLALTDQHRGKVIIGEITIIFQFVVPPPAPEKPKLPAAARGSIWQRIDWPYAAALAVMFVLEMPLLVYFQYADPPDDLTLDTIDDRWANLIVPDYQPEKKEETPEPEEGEGPTITKKKPTKVDKKPTADDPEAAAKRAARRAGIRENIQGKGMLAILGTAGVGSTGGAVADVFASGGIGGDLDGAFEGIAGVGLATEGGGSTTRGGGTGEAASIGGLATSGGGKVGLGGKAERRVGSVKGGAPTEVDGALDPAAIARVVKARLRMVQDCYERELKRDPSLAGKIEIEFTIGEDGRILEALVVSNGVSDAVGSCIVGRIRRWKFPKPDGGAVTVTYPFIFTSSS